MLDLLMAIKESDEEVDVFSSDVLCLSCSMILPFTETVTSCVHCGTAIQFEKYKELYQYSCNALRYGHQYNNYYSGQLKNKNLGKCKPHLSELPEVYKYIALAITSGIIGGASWELTKNAIKNIMNHFESEQRLFGKRIEPTINLQQLDDLANDINMYTNGLSDMHRDIQPLIFEEMCADSVKEYLDENIEISKLLEKTRKKEKHRKRAIKLHNRLIMKVVLDKVTQPTELPVKEVWAEKKDNKAI